MKKIIAALFLVSGLIFLGTGCKDKSDIKDIIKILKEKNNDKNYDCEKLQLNFKDACKTAEGKAGIVNADCKCVPTDIKKFDCVELKLNFNDACKTKDGKVSDTKVVKAKKITVDDFTR